MSNQVNDLPNIAQRFRGFLPIIVDVETGGFNPEKDALLELAAHQIFFHPKQQQWHYHSLYHAHIEPFPNANIDSQALLFNKIIPDHPFRFAVSERVALTELYQIVRKSLKETHCNRAVLVGHNPMFDLSFLLAATKRSALKRNPFHSFTTFDTATLGVLAVGQTVLAKCCKAAGIGFDENEAHSAIYDSEKTAALFCWILNTLQRVKF